MRERERQPGLLAPAIEQTVVNIRNYLGRPADLRVLQPGQGSVAAFFLDGLVDDKRLAALLDKLSTGSPLPRPEWLPGDDPHLIAALRNLNKGHAILIECGDTIRLAELALPGWQRRQIEEPLSERLVRGPREGFTESISDNTAMVRRWISDPKLRVDEMLIGKRTRTPVRLLYLEDVASRDLVAEIKRRLARIKIDGILESGYVEQFITDRRWTLFPLIQPTERSDKMAAAILEGRVGILVDKSPFSLIAPTTVNELYQSPEDYYFNPHLGTFLRFFRLLGNNLAVAFSALYVALASFNPELLPTNLAFAISESRRGVPYPIAIEVLFLEITVEIFREAGLRLPRSVSQTLGIVAGVALSYAAVQTHLVAGTSVVVVAISAVASFSAPSFAISIPWRMLKFVLLLGASTLGIVGLTLAGVIILAHAATLTSFGTPYLAPWAPLQPYELRDSVTRVPLWLRYRRPETYKARDRHRLGDSGLEGGDDAE